MRAKNLVRLLTVAAMMLMVTVAVGADEEKLPLDKVPKEVMAALKAKFEGAEVVGAEKEVDDGKTLYEFNIKHKDQTLDVTINAEAEIVEIETSITAKDLPEPVTKALEEKYPKAKFEKVEKIVKLEKNAEKPAYYEILLVTAEKKNFEVAVNADGKITNEESKDKKDGDKDDEKKKDKKDEDKKKEDKK